MKSLLSILLLLFVSLYSSSQQVQLLDSGSNRSLRGLSVVNNEVVWVSGSNGSVGRSTNAGESWRWLKIEGYETRDFRDIEAFDSLNAIVIAVAEPAIILRTSDGGLSWQKVYENIKPGMFLDAIDFFDHNHGIVVGDPIDGKFFLAITKDGGESWKDLDLNDRPAADSGEACFAASGTNIRMTAANEWSFVSGGLSSRFINNRFTRPLPLNQGNESSGANSIAFAPGYGKNNKFIVSAGGDFSIDSLRKGTFCLSEDGGLSWSLPKVSPSGYKSSVEFFTIDTLLTSGTSGVDISIDRGKTWQPISKLGFHVVKKAKQGSAIYFVGGRGRIARYVP